MFDRTSDVMGRGAGRNAGRGGVGGGGSAPWTPESLGADVALIPEINLVEGASGRVASWSHAYGAGPIFEQTVAADRPAVATSAAFNNQLVVSGDAVSRFLEQTLAAYKWPGGAVSLVCVAQLLSDNRGQLYADRTTKDGMQLEKGSGNSLSFRLIGDGSSGGGRSVDFTGFNTTLYPDPITILAEWDGVDTLSLAVSGSEVTNTGTVAQIGDPVDSAAVEPRLFRRGDNNNPGGWAMGDMFIKFGGNFTTSQLDSLRSHWATKYGI